MEQGPRVVATSDFTLAAVLLVRDFHLVGTEPDPEDLTGRRRRFLLQGSAQRSAELARRLLLDDVLVPARAFSLAQRRLKRLLHADDRAATRPVGART